MNRRIDNIDLKLNNEESQLSHLMLECLEVFEGGDVREDFDSSWVNFQIEEMVDSFRRIITLVEERSEHREVMRRIIVQGGFFGDSDDACDTENDTVISNEEEE